MEKEVSDWETPKRRGVSIGKVAGVSVFVK
jgi:hypothetical protein